VWGGLGLCHIGMTKLTVPIGYVYHARTGRTGGRVRASEERGIRTVSRARQLVDSTVLLIVTQTRQIGGRWHLAECRFSLVPLYPSHHLVPVVVTDRLLFRLTWDTGRPRGYRLRTNPETNAWHRGATCWTDCQHAQTETRNDGLSYHILYDCSARCRAVQETVSRNVVSLGTTDERLRVLAGRRRGTGRYVSDDGDTLRALYSDTDGSRVRRSNATH
jgi:hypothetical protein